MSAENAGVRLDLWLWAARFFKTRALAKEAITRSQVKIAGQACKPSRTLRVGDGLSIERAGETGSHRPGLGDARPGPRYTTLYEENPDRASGGNNARCAP